ncbi:MAG: 4Fe-4S binding protein [Armatimonadetes bacterium]|nr:4Fe-4S binding protein [Armatimonadota bacterium]
MAVSTKKMPLTGAYNPSPTTGRPDVPPRQPLTPWNMIGMIGQGAWTIVLGHWVTLKNFWRKKVTDRYPHRQAWENWQPKPGYRGDFALISDRETGKLRCIACMQCQTNCPSACIHIKAEGKGKERHPVEFFIDAGLCQYCWICVEVCPVGAITMTPDYETAVDDPRKLIRDLEYLRTRGLEYDDVLRPEEAEHD